MSLQPYEHYAQIGNDAAYSKWNARLKWFVGGFGLLGLAVAVLASKDVAYAVFGAAAGAALGYGFYRWGVYASATSTTDDLYRVDWCAERGMKYLGAYYPGNAPYATSGDKREATDAFEGTWNGLDTLFYNFTYTEKGDSDDPDTDYDFRIMRLKGRDLPIRRLTIRQRSALNKFKWVDNLQGKLTKEKPISLESAAFNEKFDLTIDDAADEIWIRRIFDPATIAALIDGRFTIPDVQFYDHCWWFVEREHFKIRDLDTWIPKQKIAAEAVDHLSRIQTL